ncbi:UrcA family protein [Phenylobacterium sp.]|uniref:UrcA family protein n=1 Tax=Phenylobacterium sp. TaxID=1871053 RepID=UPI0028A21DD9|nr:UrcA family protein [Phenylobacterium sp.]
MLKIFAFSAALALVAGPVLAAPAGYGSAAVRVGDLNTGRPADVERLQKRLQAASLEACGAQDASARMVKQAIARSDCYRETLAQASAQVRTGLAIR